MCVCVLKETHCLESQLWNLENKTSWTHCPRSKAVNKIFDSVISVRLRSFFGSTLCGVGPLLTSFHVFSGIKHMTNYNAVPHARPWKVKKSCNLKYYFRCYPPCWTSSLPQKKIKVICVTSLSLSSQQRSSTQHF